MTRSLKSSRMPERTVVVLDTNVVLSAILTKLRTKFALPLDLLNEWRDLFESASIHVLPDYKADICRDPKDNMLLDTAAAAGAAYLITGDKDLLELRDHQGTKIMTVAEALA